MITIALDLEGTLVDIERAHHEGHLRAAADWGVQLTFDEALVKIPHFIGGPDEAVARDVIKLSGSPHEVNDFLVRKRKYYRKAVQSMDIKPRPGVLDALGWFKTFGYRFAIGSLTTSDEARILLQRSGLDQVVSPNCIVLREDVKRLKPFPDVFQETARRMCVNPGAQIVFEDSPNGVKSAIAAGCIAAIGMPVYNRPETIVPLLNAGCKRVFIDWREINLQVLIANLIG